MPEVDIIYSDVKFIRTQDGTDHEVSSSAPNATYSEVKFSKGPSSQQRSSHGTAAEEPSPPRLRRQTGLKLEQVFLLLSILLLAAAVTALTLVFLENRDTKRNLKKLQLDLRNFTETQNKTTQLQASSLNCPEPLTPAKGECQTCDLDWKLHGEKCYFFTETRLPWVTAREKCKEMGGDLVVIETKEEQHYLKETLKTLMKLDEVKYWIGLTDAEEEAKWKWVDGSMLNPSLQFWLGNEPDNYIDEDCVRMGEKGEISDLNIWLDMSCQITQNYICEKDSIRRICF